MLLWFILNEDALVNFEATRLVCHGLKFIVCNCLFLTNNLTLSSLIIRDNWIKTQEIFFANNSLQFISRSHISEEILAEDHLYFYRRHHDKRFKVSITYVRTSMVIQGCCESTWKSARYEQRQL